MLYSIKKTVLFKQFFENSLLKSAKEYVITMQRRKI